MTDTKNGLQKGNQGNQVKRDIRDFIQSDTVKAQMALALPKHITPDRMARVALTAFLRTPKLLDCSRESLLQALMTCSQAGLEPDGRNAHLIPYGNVVQVIFDYKGLVELAMRSGVVANIHADVVRDKDEFEYDRGELRKHKVNFREPRGEVYAVYALVRFKDATEKCEVMTVDEVESIRARSKAAKSGPWVTDWNEMAKKTVFRRLSKWITLSPEFRDAVNADDDVVEPSSPIRVVAPLFSEPATNGTQAEAPKPADPTTIAALREEISRSKFDEARLLAYLEEVGSITHKVDTLEEAALDNTEIIGIVMRNFGSISAQLSTP